jgi:hypothetical protein
VFPVCPYIECNFVNLFPDLILGDSSQQAKLLAACGVKVSAKQGNIVRHVNVFNSSKRSRHDPDLGSPNQACPGGGPGRGVEGMPGSIF